MKKTIIGIIIGMLVLTSMYPVTAVLLQKPVELNPEVIGIQNEFKSLMPILSPDGKSYPCIMFCENQKQALAWKESFDASGFQTAWQQKFIKLTIFLFLPGTILLFGLNEFRNWYMDLFLKMKHKDEFVDFLQTYDPSNSSGMITYLWLTGTTNRPVDFKTQPDNTWVENSWIQEGTSQFFPNPEIWYELHFWYFGL